MVSYDDIIELQRPVSGTHPPMSLYDRAAQFSPFAALTGYDAAVKEAARMTEGERELDDEEKERINEKLLLMAEYAGGEWTAAITYFQPDEKKDGGAYVTCTGGVREIDEYRRIVMMQDDTAIPIDRIRKIELLDTI